VAWTSSHMCAGKRWTLPATIVTIFSHMTKDVAVFVKCDKIFRLFFFGNYHYHKIKLLTFTSWCGKIHKETLHGFYRKFTSLSSSERILKIHQELTKLSPWHWCTTFLGAQCIYDAERDLSLTAKWTNKN